jgi:hypothetical protein
VFERAKKGDKSAVPVMLAMFAAKPSLVDIFGSPERWTQDAIVREASNKDLGIEEGMGRKMAKIRKDLAGPNPTAIESMLAHRAALCWLRLNMAEYRDAAAEGRSLTQAEFDRKRLDSLHKRYLSSLTALAQVRKLDLTAIQVNLDMRAGS